MKGIIMKRDIEDLIQSIAESIHCYDDWISDSAAKQLAEQEGGKAYYLDSLDEGDYPTIIYTFSDGSGCLLSYGSCYTH